MPPPNVLIFCVDEMRADHISPMGNPIVQTPNLEQIAARGTVFTQGYCNNPICMPARTTMFTGLLPRDHGVRCNGQPGRPDLPTLPGVLAEAGYRTHATGKLHLTSITPPAGHDPAQFPESMSAWRDGAITRFPVPYFGLQSVDFVNGHTAWAFGEYLPWLRAHGGDPALLAKPLAPPTGAPQCYKMALPEELHYNRFIADAAIRTIDAPDDRPFFIWCSFPDPHMPVAPPAPYCDLYDPADIPLPTRREGEFDDLPAAYRRTATSELSPNGVNPVGVTDDHWREMIALTLGMVTHVDAEVGRVLDALERTGKLDDTIIVFISDHGDMMGDHGMIWKSFFTFRGCINIPYLVAAPGKPGGRSSDALVSQIDLMPGVLDLCGVPMPGADWVHQQTIYERGTVAPLSPYPGRSFAGLLDGSVARIHDGVIVENDDPTTGYQARALVTSDYRVTLYPGTPDGELFDLRHDPRELHNLWYDPAHAALRAEALARFADEYCRQTPWFPIPAGNA